MSVDATRKPGAGKGINKIWRKVSRQILMRSAKGETIHSLPGRQQTAIASVPSNRLDYSILPLRRSKSGKLLPRNIQLNIVKVIAGADDEQDVITVSQPIQQPGQRAYLPVKQPGRVANRKIYDANARRGRRYCSILLGNLGGDNA